MRLMINTVKTALLFVALTGVIQAAEPLKKLSDAELDHVAAGYLTVEVLANADAFGLVTKTKTLTNATVRQLPDKGDEYLYSEGKGYAFAYAKGTDVYTFVDGFFDTDEEIVSIKFVYKKKQHKLKKRKSYNKNKPTKHKHRKNKRLTKKVNKHQRSKNKGHGQKRNKSKPRSEPRIKSEISALKIRVVTRVPKL